MFDADANGGLAVSYQDQGFYQGRRKSSLIEDIDRYHDFDINLSHLSSLAPTTNAIAAVPHREAYITRLGAPSSADWHAFNLRVRERVKRRVLFRFA